VQRDHETDSAAPLAGPPPLAAFRREGMGYVYEPHLGDESGGLRLRLDYIKKGVESHTGEVTIESTLPGMRGLLHQARYNLVSSTAEPNLVKAITRIVEGTGDDGLPWGLWVRTFFSSCLAAERQGEPFRTTGPQVPRQARLAPLVERLLPNGQNVLLYGPGGTGKGWLAVGLAVAVTLGLPFAGYEAQQAPVLYCDWEDSFEVFCERVAAVAAGLGVAPPTIHYRPCYGSLRDQAHQIARYAAEHAVGLLIIDSVEMASAFAGDQSTYEDRARGLFEAVRAIRGGLTRPMSTLLIDHVSEQGRAQQSGQVKPYGSVFKGNWCRLAWEVRKQQEAEALVSNVGLFQWKSNHTASLAAVGLRLEWDDPFEPGLLTIHGDDVRDHDELAQRLGQRDRVKAALRGGPRAPKEIAELTGLSAEKVRVVLHRDQSSRLPVFTRVGTGYGLREPALDTGHPHLEVIRREEERAPGPRLPYRDHDDGEGITDDDDDILF
jgi:AAA domain